MGALTVVNVTVTVKVTLHIQACGKRSWAVRGFPSCGCIRQQCGQTVHSVLFFQMCSVLNSTSHNMECSDGLTVNGLHVITPPHNMYCTGTQESGTSATQPNDDNQHTHTHTHTHARTPWSIPAENDVDYCTTLSPECNLHVTSMSPSGM